MKRFKQFTISGEAVGAGCVVLNDEQGLAIGLTDEILEKGEVRGKTEVNRGGFYIYSHSFTALCVSAVFKDHWKSSLTVHGLRTMRNCKEEGYQLEGTVSVNGWRVRGFTSSQLFRWRGKLIDVAVIHACPNPNQKGAE